MDIVHCSKVKCISEDLLYTTLIYVCTLPYAEFTIDESSMDASSLQLSPPSTRATTYQPAVVDISRFQRLLESERGDVGGNERKREDDKYSSTNKEMVDVSSIAQSDSQQRDREVPSNMSSVESETENSIIHCTCVCFYSHPYIVILQCIYTLGDIAGKSRQPIVQQQQHPLHIVHKVPVNASKHHSPPTTITSTTTPHISTSNQINSNDYNITRNERHRKLTPGRLHNNSMYVCMYVYLCIMMYVSLKFHISYSYCIILQSQCYHPLIVVAFMMICQYYRR